MCRYSRLSQGRGTRVPEMMEGVLAGSQAEWDRYRKYERSPLAEGEEQEAELERLIESRAKTIAEHEQGESVEQREERDFKRRMAQVDAEEREANRHRRIAWFRHLRRVYTSRLDEVEATLQELA